MENRGRKKIKKCRKDAVLGVRVSEKTKTLLIKKFGNAQNALSRAIELVLKKVAWKGTRDETFYNNTK